MLKRIFMWTMIAGAFAVCAAVVVRPAYAQSMQVDTAIVFLSDVSMSMTASEREFVASAHQMAIQSDEFLSAVQRGAYGRVALAYVEYADHAQTVVRWSIVNGPVSAAQFAQSIETSPRNALGSQTGIGNAMAHAYGLLSTLPVSAENLVVDVVGDGRNNTGMHPSAAREMLIDYGAKVNALAISSHTYVEKSYREDVAGGIGHFVMGVRELSDFPMALRQKLILELF